jgi:CheY-like chemotaxis protein
MSGDKKTILVVDDEPDIRDFITTLLEDNGYATMSADDGGQGIDKVKEHRPDLVTLDITMPEKSGVRFYRDMKESDEWKDIPIIIITGIASEFEKFITTRKQVPPPEAYVSKPIDPKEILELVKKFAG